MAPDDLAAFLARYPPFDGLPGEDVARLAAAATVQTYAAGDLVLDAFRDPSAEIFVVLDGQVSLWNAADRLDQSPDETVTVGGVFGFSALLTERSVGPIAVASTAAQIARIPGDVAAGAFASRRGAKFLADSMFALARTAQAPPTYDAVEDLIREPPLVVAPSDPIEMVARRMTEAGVGYAVVPRPEGGYGVVTDSTIRARIVGEGLPPSTPALQLCAEAVVVARHGDSAAEALVRMLEAGASEVVVLDRAGALLGVVTARAFALSPTTADVSLHEQLSRARDTDELVRVALRIPDLLRDLLSRGLASGRVIAVHSTMLDAAIRRAIELVVGARADLSLDAFTWLSLGSNGRREAVLSSDIDSAVTFAGSPEQGEVTAYLEAFRAVQDVLAQGGLRTDEHGASASRPAFARTNEQWRAAGQQWLADPIDDQGAIMTSLLVDGRPIFGDPGLPAVAQVFTELRSHPGTMRLLLQDSLARRARLHSPRDLRDLLTRRPEMFDVKAYALLPIVNLARWAALSVGSAVLPTVDRLEVAGGSAMLPLEQSRTLIEVFEVLQRLRLRYQLLQYAHGDQPSDRLMVESLSPIDRSIVAQAVREIAAAQRRMTNLSAYLPAEEWTRREPV